MLRPRPEEGRVSASAWLSSAFYNTATTRYEHREKRCVALVMVFLGFALAGTFLPWPWGLAAITVGVLAIFVVFRHWLRDEHEALFELRIEQKDIKIRGGLAVETAIACSFLLVFAPVAFAQLQANGYS